MPRLQFVGHRLSGHNNRSCSTTLSPHDPVSQVTSSPTPGIAPSARIAHGYKRASIAIPRNGAEDSGR